MNVWGMLNILVHSARLLVWRGAIRASSYVNWSRHPRRLIGPRGHLAADTVDAHFPKSSLETEIGCVAASPNQAVAWSVSGWSCAAPEETCLQNKKITFAALITAE